MALWFRRCVFLTPLLILAVLAPRPATARKKEVPGRPKLVVVIVIDQFRYDFLTRFAPFFGRDGFNRLRREGAFFTAAHYRHAATYTGPGHALILSGSYPHRNGIVANYWYNRATARREGILFDPDARLFGVTATSADDTSPRNFIGSTLGDQLKLATGGRAKVVALSLKDRAAILLGGRLGKAYWFHEGAGGFVSSSYYSADLPEWVKQFNARHLPDSYFGHTWERLLPVDAYRDCTADDAPWETDALGAGRTFPHRLTGGLTKPGLEFYSAFTATPWGTEYELEFARQAIDAEGLGADDAPDLLGISITANDIAGHAYGPYSHEIADLTVRTDRLLAAFLADLHRRFRPGELLLVLTSDHGVAPVPEHAASLGLEAGRITTAVVRETVTKALTERFGAGEWVVGAEDPSVFLNRAILAEKKVDLEEAARVAGEACLAIPGMAAYFTRGQLLHGPLPPTDLAAAVERSFHPERSGDLVLVPKPNYFWSTKYSGQTTGTTHGTPYEYDSHVPLIIAGPGVRAAEVSRFVDMADLAPTLAALLGIDAPAACEGRPIPEVTGGPE
jgi:predicted AlkP superfamily pyrophosphatase or phosphodiesterase